MRHKVATRSQEHVIHVILPEVVELLKLKIGPQASFSVPSLRKALSEQKNTSVNHSGVFDGVQRKCVKIPRDLISKDVMVLIDKGNEQMQYRSPNTFTPNTCTTN